MLKFWVFMIFFGCGERLGREDKEDPQLADSWGATVGILFGGAGMAWNEMGEVPGIVLGAALAALRMFTAVLPGLALYRFRNGGSRGCEAGGRHCGVHGIWSRRRGDTGGLCLGAVWALSADGTAGIMRRRFCYLIGYVRRVLLTGKIEAYYDRSQDGEEAVIPLGVCLVGAAAVAVVWCLCA